MEKKYVISKKWGETPLEALERLRADEKIPTDVPMTYAGRLDPAAEGLLIILTGEECKKKEEYMALSKTYVAEILFGVSTDSYDLLGLPSFSRRGLRGGDSYLNTITTPSGVPSTPPRKGGEEYEAVELYLKNHLGKQMQKYPYFSSKNIDTGTLPPPHEVELISYKNIKMGERTREEIVSRAEKLTEIVTGDFRQAEIKKAWQDLPVGKYQTVSVELEVSSGFYIRQLAEDLGGCLYSLVRTQIG